MNYAETAALTPPEINARIAKICGTDDLCHIEKRGMFYRPNAAGYTSNRAEAWKLPRAEAKKYEMYADRTDCPGEQVLLKPADCPDYYGDLNGMATAWKTLDSDKKERFCAILQPLIETQMRSGLYDDVVANAASIWAMVFVLIHE